MASKALLLFVVGDVYGMAYLQVPLPLPGLLPNLTKLRSQDQVPVASKETTREVKQILMSADDDLRLAPTNDRQLSCGGSFTNLALGDSGNISSPLYPANYPPDLKCVWWLKALDGLKISMTCTDVLTQTCDAGYFDYILVSPDWGWTKYYLLCGDYSQYTPLTFNSTDNFASVYFRTSDQLQFRGFRCSYKVVAPAVTTTTPSTTKTTPPTTAVPVNYNGEAGCGKVNNRIWGGTQVAPAHRYPWMVGLTFNGQWFCGGTLVSKQWVLTAAHCTAGALSAYAYLGAHNLYVEETGRLILFTQVFVPHPRYLADKILNDVALVQLPANALPAYTARIQPACLPIKSTTDAAVNSLPFAAVGWGKTENGTTISPVLNELRVGLVGNDVCKLSFGDIIQPTNVCAQGANGTGTCQGDSGSSLQYTTPDGIIIQYGVVSFGAATGCGTGYPNGFSRITTYLDFIANVTGLTFY